MFISFKTRIEEQLNRKFKVFIIISYTFQVVSGTNYAVRIQVDNGLFITVRIYLPPKHTGEKPRLIYASIEDPPSSEEDNFDSDNDVYNNPIDVQSHSKSDSSDGDDFEKESIKQSDASELEIPKGG